MHKGNHFVGQHEKNMLLLLSVSSPFSYDFVCIAYEATVIQSPL